MSLQWKNLTFTLTLLFVFYKSFQSCSMAQHQRPTSLFQNTFF